MPGDGEPGGRWRASALGAAKASAASEEEGYIGVFIRRYIVPIDVVAKRRR
jgi:hypothetical protein